MRGSIPHGEFTMEDVLKTSPFGNRVERIEVYGSTLLEILQHSVMDYNPKEPHGKFLQVAGKGLI